LFRTHPPSNSTGHEGRGVRAVWAGTAGGFLIFRAFRGDTIAVGRWWGPGFRREGRERGFKSRHEGITFVFGDGESGSLALFRRLAQRNPLQSIKKARAFGLRKRALRNLSSSVKPPQPNGVGVLGKRAVERRHGRSPREPESILFLGGGTAGQCLFCSATGPE